MEVKLKERRMVPPIATMMIIIAYIHRATKSDQMVITNKYTTEGTIKICLPLSKENVNNRTAHAAEQPPYEN